jgi:hypothetical protein
MHDVLEPRVFLDAHMQGNELWVTGTPEDDQIRFTRDGGEIVVSLNATISRFAASGVWKIISGGYGGNDRLDAAAMSVRVEIFGGEGDDTLIAGSGDDYACASYGNDVVRGGGGDDLLCGRVGDDNVAGGSGNDTVTGDEGLDVVSGGNGNDLVFGGSQYKDPVEGSPDTVSGGAGYDTVVENSEVDLMSEVEKVLPGAAARYPFELDARYIGVRAVTKGGVKSLWITVRVPAGAYAVKYDKVRVERGQVTIRALGFEDARHADPKVPLTRTDRVELGKIKPGKYRLRLVSRGDLEILDQTIRVG